MIIAGQSTTDSGPKVSWAMPVRIAGSLRSIREAGFSFPWVAWTIDMESSTLSLCGGVPPVRSSSVRPRVGRISDTLPGGERWVPLSLVEMYTVMSRPRRRSR